MSLRRAAVALSSVLVAASFTCRANGGLDRVQRARGCRHRTGVHAKRLSTRGSNLDGEKMAICMLRIAAAIGSLATSLAVNAAALDPTFGSAGTFTFSQT